MKLKDLLILSQPKTKSFLDKVRQDGRVSTEKTKQILGDIIGEIKGEKGDTGDRGPEGPRGERGFTGETGKTGKDSTVPGPKGEDGKNADETKIVAEVIKQIPKPKDGVDGRSVDPNFVAEIVLTKIPKPKDGKDAVFTGEEAVRKINALPLDEDKMIDVSHIKGLRQVIGSARKGGGGTTVVSEDLSAQANDVTMTFTTSKRIGFPISLASTQFPTILRPTIDYTWSLNSITLDAALSPIATGQTIIFIFAEG